MTVEGTRGSAFPVGEPWEMEDTDELVWLDKSRTSGTGSGAGGTLVRTLRRRILRGLAPRRWPAISLSAPLPVRMLGGWKSNTNAFAYTHMWTHNHAGVWRLYVVGLDYQGHIRLFWRNILASGSTTGRGPWFNVDLSTKIALTYRHNEHDITCVFVDSGGYVHVMFNQQGGDIDQAYTWCTVANPTAAQLGNLANWAAGDMNITPTSPMGYPAMVKRSDGKILYIYRESLGGGAGSPTDARARVVVYTATGAPSANNWTIPTAGGVSIIDGHGDAGGVRGPYVWNPIVDPNNGLRVGLFFCWRLDSTGENKSLGYIETLDGGATWKKIDGTAITLPFTSAQYTGAAIVNDIPATPVATFINHGGACFDSRGRPHVVYSQDVVGSKWFTHGYSTDGATWTNDLLPQSTQSAERPTIVRDNTGNVYTIFRNRAGGKIGSIWMVDCTPGSTYKNVEVPILNYELSSSEVPHSEIALNELGQVCILAMSSVTSFADNDTTSPDADYYHRAYVLTLDCDRLADIVQGNVHPPTLELLRSTAVPGFGTEIVVTQTSVAELGGISPVISCNSDTPDDQLFMRFVGQARVDASTTMTLKLCETTGAGVTTVSAEHPVTETTNSPHRTPWLPVLTLAGPAVRGTISLQAGITTGTGKGYVRGSLELARLHPVEAYA